MSSNRAATAVLAIGLGLIGLLLLGYGAWLWFNVAGWAEIPVAGVAIGLALGTLILWRQPGNHIALQSVTETGAGLGGSSIQSVQVRPRAGDGPVHRVSRGPG